MVSPAAKRERAAAGELREASDLVFAASNRFRAGTTATYLSGQLEAARLIIERVADVIERRTED